LPKTDTKVVETPEDKAGTKKDKPAAPKRPRKQAPKKDEPEEAPDFNAVDFEAYPLSAVSGQVTGVIKLNGAVPILEIALVGWVGEAPVSNAASDIKDVEKVLADLRKAAKAAKR